MKKLQKIGSLIKGLAAGLAVMTCVSVAHATPYASGITNIVLGGSNYVQFIMNEGGASVSVVTQPSGASNVLSANMSRGVHNFFLGTDTSFQIYCTKLGNGTPAQIGVATSDYGGHGWGGPRGMAVDRDPKNGNQFGRIFVGNNSTAGSPFSGQGLYAFNADLSDSYLGHGGAASLNSIFTGGGTSAPWKMTYASNGFLYVTIYATFNATIYQVDPDLLTSTLVLGPVGENQGIAAGSHADPTGVFVAGSAANGDMVLYDFDPGLAAPATTTLGIGNEGQTTAGQANILYRYNIGAGPLPWTNAPDAGVNLGLPGFLDSQIGDCTLGTDPTKVYGQFYRANLSDPCIQVFDTNLNILYSSFTGGGSADAFQLAYCGVRISPDGRYLATIDVNNVFIVCNLTNGIPDNSTIFRITTGMVANSRGLDFDAADNLYAVSSGSEQMQTWSLGNSGITVTGNDITGTNGTFQLILPSTTATVAATVPQASQNYINSTPAGTPIAGVFRINLNTNNNILPVPVTIALTGTAANGTQYTINSGTDANGVTIASNLVTFPAGVCPVAGSNWFADVIVTPTAVPLSGPSYGVTITMSSGGDYVAGSPKVASLSIANTGPQFLFMTAAAATVGPTMNRGIPNDYAAFTITRWGDTNGPNNLAGSVNPLSYTVTNITYKGTALFTNDYGAQAQRIDPVTPGVRFSAPTAGSPGIKINPGNVAVTCVVGLPVFHTNPFQPPTNVTITLNLTNSLAPTNGGTALSMEGTPYLVTNTTITLTEVDNTKGPETVLWSNALTNSTDNTWTMVYANTNLGNNSVLPVVVGNYTNGQTAISTGGTNDFEADFGYPVASDSVAPSPVMAANGWTTALRMTANKNLGSPAAVNLYPQGQNFYGNVAFRFSMYLSTVDIARGFPGAGTFGREFALFGIDHQGTNANWRPTAAVAAGTGSGPINCDGIWVGIDAGSGSLTPADFDAFNSPPVPNSGTTDIVSAASTTATGIFKAPPFINDESLSGGTPANLWVDVSLEKSQTITNIGLYNINTFVDRGAVLATFTTTNQPSNGQLVGNYTNGTVMLGYLDPVSDISDGTAFVYYSNVRAVELSPFVYAGPSSQLVLAGTDVNLTASAAYATSPMTNTWTRGTTTPATTVVVDTSATTNFTDTLTLSNVTVGSNYWAKFSDPAGSVTSSVASIEVIGGPANVTTNAGSNAVFIVTASGQSAPTYQWKTNGTSLANGTKYAGVTTASLTVSNVQSADTLVTYAVTASNTATNAFAVTSPQSVTTAGATLSITTQPPSFTGLTVSNSIVSLSFTSPNGGDTTGSFTLLSAPIVTGPYTNTPGTITGGPGAFQVTAPQTTNASMFYRLLHN